MCVQSILKLPNTKYRYSPSKYLPNSNIPQGEEERERDVAGGLVLVVKQS